MAIDELQDGRYRHLRLLGTGGMGEVYLMQDKRVNRRVAIKVLRAESSIYPEDDKTTDSVRLFEREARAIAALDHPNILPLYDFGEEVRDDVAVTYMVMPYCADGSLETWLRQRSGEPLPPQQVAMLIEQAAEALDYAHEHKMIHLDVKPSNFLIRGNRKTPQHPTLLLADFGIARNFTTVSSSSRTIRGTPTAMAPEQWSGEPVFASDQYALAVMTYEMLVGRPPFVGTMEQLMYRHFQVEAPPLSSFNPRLPAALDAVLQRALHKKPEERYPSIVEFANALTEAASQAVADSEEASTDYGTLALSQSEADAGISRMLTLVGGEEITVSVPAGAQDGQVLRLPKPGASSDEQAGVILVNIAVQKPVLARSSDLADEEPLDAQTTGDEQDFETVAARPAAEARAGQASETPAHQVAEVRAVPAPETPKLQPVSLSASAKLLPPEHDLPTIAGLEDATVAPRALTPPAQSRSRFGVIAFVSLLVVLLLLAGSIFVLANHLSPNHLSSAVGAQATSTHVAQKATAVPKATPTLTPTVGPGMYLAGTYNGSMSGSSDVSGGPLSVLLVQTNGSGLLNGSVRFNSSVEQTYALQGKVDMQGNFIFAVKQTGQLPLVFYGGSQPGNYLKGNYCRTAAASCLAPDGYFTVGPRS